MLKDPFKSISIKISQIFYISRKKILKFIWNHRRPQIAKSIMSKKNKVEGITLSGSNYLTKLCSSKQHDTSIKTDTQTSETEWKTQNKPMHLPSTNLWQTPGVGDGQGGLACCDSWGHKESDTTERLNWTELNWIFDKGAKSTQLEKDSLFNKWWWENWKSTCNRIKLDPYLTPHTKLTQNGLTT